MSLYGDTYRYSMGNHYSQLTRHQSVSGGCLGHRDCLPNALTTLQLKASG